jgi:hypothetical protein
MPLQPIKSGFTNFNEGGMFNFNIPPGGVGLMNNSHENFEAPHHNYNRQHSFVIGPSPIPNKESLNSLANPNLILPLNKANPLRTD